MKLALKLFFFYRLSVNLFLRSDDRTLWTLWILGIFLLQIKPYNIYVTVAYPPDTDTPGLAEENKTKVNIHLTYFKVTERSPWI